MATTSRMTLAKTAALFASLALGGCSNTAIEDGAQFGPFTQVKTFFTSSFVAETRDGVVLIDTGYSKTAKPIARHLEGRGLSLSDVKHVVITHGHSDHVRALHLFDEATVYAHADEVERIAVEGPEGGVVDQTLANGQIVSIGGLGIEVFHVPGHTAGNLVLLSEGVLLTGDTAMSYKNGTVGPAPARYADDPDQARRELLALRDRLRGRVDSIDSVVFAHSGGLTDMGPFWEMAE
ncbi:MAG: MBL fold metallo-hydrolase [Proteobacteria bacterium]|nr:MBL fold metallo-hydrolase [Pseudomonadota bacterium]